MNIILFWLFAFANMAILDIAWVGYNRMTSQGRKLPSGLWALALAGFSGVNTIAVVESPWYLTATCAGAFAGTIVGLYLAPVFEAKAVSAETLFPGVTPDAARALNLELALADVAAELQRARMKFRKFHSAHEGYAVALEEFDELKAHVWKKQKDRDLDAMRKEAIEAAAMCTAIAAECCDEITGRV
jgi:hypothetical protein